MIIKYLKNNLGYILVWILALVPLFIWFFMKPLDIRFSSSGQIFRSLGQVTGLLGMALLSLNFILSARFEFLDRWFNGLNRVYLKHHIIGALSFCFLLFHPVFLTVQFLFLSLKSAFAFVISVDNWPLNFGKLGLLVMIVLLGITFYAHLKYQKWKKTHQYLGLVLFLGGLHMLFIGSDVSSNPILKYYMLALATMAAYSYIYYTILGIYKKKEYKYQLIEVIKVNETVAELKLKSLGEKIKFLPGQFIFLRFADEKGMLSESHPFSITSSPENDYLSLGIKTLGDYTQMIYNLKPGAVASLQGPFGIFSYTKAENKKQIWVAGGIGITPFLSMARAMNTLVSEHYEIDLYYSVKNKNEAVFDNELIEISKQNNNFKFHPHFSEQDGFISADMIKKDKDVSGAEVFLCGPQGFMQSLREQFIKLGFNNNLIHSEEFSL